MANPHRGEVEFEAGGKTYKLSYSANALCELEDALGKSVNEIAALMQDTQNFRLSVVRTVFWAGLLDHNDGLDMKGAKAIFKHLDPVGAVELVSRAFSLTFPTREGDGGDPPKPGQDGTGPAF